jgi:hypothetical protein
MKIRVNTTQARLASRATVLATTILALVGLGAFLNMTTIAQGPPRTVDLREKVKNKKFSDGRRVEIEALDTGEKILAEIKDGDFRNWFLVGADGTEVKAVVRKKGATTTTTVTASCQATVVTTTTTVDKKGHASSVTGSFVMEIPCPKNVTDPTGAQDTNPGSNSNSNKPKP